MQHPTARLTAVMFSDLSGKHCSVTKTVGCFFALKGDSMNFSERILSLRVAQGWTVEQVAQYLQVAPQTLTEWESGVSFPPEDRLDMICTLYGQTREALLGGSAFQQKEESAPQPKKSGSAHYEYKSKRTIGNLPLVHINIGLGAYTAKGFFAVGNAAMGVISVGLASMGVISFGLVSLGVLALAFFGALGVFAAGLFAIGVFAAGSVALGVFSAGAVSIGWFAVGGAAIGNYSFGGVALAHDIGFGGASTGIIAIGDEPNGRINITSSMDADEFRELVAEVLPKTPQFVTDFFAKLVENFT